MIHECNCRSEYQDALYGPWRRVHNPMTKTGGGGPQHRCTVCGNIWRPRVKAAPKPPEADKRGRKRKKGGRK